MKDTGAAIAVRALEALGVRFTFGIPGVHNTELYDALEASRQIRPVLVTHEGCAAFMADAVSRVSDTTGVLAIVPAAGLTHAASGIGEAFLAGIPMLVLAGGIRTDLDKRYQLHEIDQLALVRPIVKAAFRAASQRDVAPMIFEAWRIAHEGEPGPVFVELPVNVQLFTGEWDGLPATPEPPAPRAPDAGAIARAAGLLAGAQRPCIFAGWGAHAADDALIRVAEFLEAPVATTLQGLSVFPSGHPLHVGFGFGEAAVPAARNAFAGCDAMLAVGARFAEIATGSYGVTVPGNLVHIDINPAVFNANFPASVAIEADARAALVALLAALHARGTPRAADTGLRDRIARDKQAYRAGWHDHARAQPGRVNPARFFDALRAAMPDDAIAAVDDGNHTYLAAELFPLRASRSLIVPTDFNCMGYAVPAAIGAKLACPVRDVFAIVGDGAFLMTGLEIVTAASQGLGIAWFVFHDGELSQIAQAQQIPFNRKTCSVLGALDLAGIAQGVGAEYVRIADDDALAESVARARDLARAGRPVIVDVNIDYSKRTAFTQGAVKTNFRRLPLSQRLRIAGRALGRRIAR